jgi:D-alanyl-D-alanine carboxypeptidase/D-alanyl-D-alanine-endopeptidase (penicillin-binding protein 4)
LRGTAPGGYRPDVYVEGLLSGLAYDRGFADAQETAFQLHPARFAASQLVSALRAGGVRLPAATPVASGHTPAGAPVLAAVDSPRMSTLISLTNTPSDNFFAEMLLKGLGARFGAGGSSAAGAGVVKSELAGAFGIHPALNDGSGLSRIDATSPRDVAEVLGQLAANADFVRSLAIAGHTGTLSDRMVGTPAAGRCEAKTGTLHDVSNLAGYCRAADGHTLAFAFLMNSVDPTAARALQDSMAVALARYDG